MFTEILHVLERFNVSKAMKIIGQFILINPP